MAHARGKGKGEGEGEGERKDENPSESLAPTHAEFEQRLLRLEDPEKRELYRRLREAIESNDSTSIKKIYAQLWENINSEIDEQATWTVIERDLITLCDGTLLRLCEMELLSSLNYKHIIDVAVRMNNDSVLEYSLNKLNLSSLDDTFAWDYLRYILFNFDSVSLVERVMAKTALSSDLVAEELQHRFGLYDWRHFNPDHIYLFPRVLIATGTTNDSLFQSLVDRMARHAADMHRPEDERTKVRKFLGEIQRIRQEVKELRERGGRTPTEAVNLYFARRLLTRAGLLLEENELQREIGLASEELKKFLKENGWHLQKIEQHLVNDPFSVSLEIKELLRREENPLLEKINALEGKAMIRQFINNSHVHLAAELAVKIIEINDGVLVRNEKTFKLAASESVTRNRILIGEEIPVRLNDEERNEVLKVFLEYLRKYGTYAEKKLSDHFLKVLVMLFYIHQSKLDDSVYQKGSGQIHAESEDYEEEVSENEPEPDSEDESEPDLEGESEPDLEEISEPDSKGESESDLEEVWQGGSNPDLSPSSDSPARFDIRGQELEKAKTTALALIKLLSVDELWRLSCMFKGQAYGDGVDLAVFKQFKEELNKILASKNAIKENLKTTLADFPTEMVETISLYAGLQSEPERKQVKNKPTSAGEVGLFSATAPHEIKQKVEEIKRRCDQLIRGIPSTLSSTKEKLPLKKLMLDFRAKLDRLFTGDGDAVVMQHLQEKLTEAMKESREIAQERKTDAMNQEVMSPLRELSKAFEELQNMTRDQTPAQQGSGPKGPS